MNIGCIRTMSLKTLREITSSALAPLSRAGCQPGQPGLLWLLFGDDQTITQAVAVDLFSDNSVIKPLTPQTVPSLAEAAKNHQQLLGVAFLQDLQPAQAPGLPLAVLTRLFSTQQLNQPEVAQDLTVLLVLPTEADSFPEIVTTVIDRDGDILEALLETIDDVAEVAESNAVSRPDALVPSSSAAKPLPQATKIQDIPEA